MAALRILLDREGMAISPKHITLSTSGIVPGIERMAQEPVRPKLADFAERVERRAARRRSCRSIASIRSRNCSRLAADIHCERGSTLTFEYVLLGGFNDAPEDARRVARLLANIRVKVNLIPWNPGNLPYQLPDGASE